MITSNPWSALHFLFAFPAHLFLSFRCALRLCVDCQQYVASLSRICGCQWDDFLPIFFFIKFFREPWRFPLWPAMSVSLDGPIRFWTLSINWCWRHAEVLMAFFYGDLIRSLNNLLFIVIFFVTRSSACYSCKLLISIPCCRGASYQV